MLQRRVGIASRSQVVGLRDIIKVASAINLQANRDLQDIWDISASVTALADPESIEPGVWPIFIVDDVGQDGAAGLHLTDHQQPYALVQAGATWSLTASHECLEMLVDPSGNRLVPSSTRSWFPTSIRRISSIRSFRPGCAIASLAASSGRGRFCRVVISPGSIPGSESCSNCDGSTNLKSSTCQVILPNPEEAPFVASSTHKPARRCDYRTSMCVAVLSPTVRSVRNGCRLPLPYVLRRIRWPGVPAVLQPRCRHPMPRKQSSTPTRPSFRFLARPRLTLVGISKTAGSPGNALSSCWRTVQICKQYKTSFPQA